MKSPEDHEEFRACAIAAAEAQEGVPNVLFVDGDRRYFFRLPGSFDSRPSYKGVVTLHDGNPWRGAKLSYRYTPFTFEHEGRKITYYVETEESYKAWVRSWDR